MHRLFAQAALVLVCAVLGVSWTDVRRATVAAQPDHSTGERVYLRDCATCHGLDGSGTPRGVSLQTTGAAGAHFYLSTGRMPIGDPDDPIERRPPAYSEEVIEALVAHVAGFGDGPTIPDLRTADADLALGGSRYRLHCAQCHGAAGVGVALAAGVTAPSLMESAAGEVAGSLAVGPGAMPAFYPAVLDEDEVASIAAYVAELQQPIDRGGSPMARSGRLDELLAAWGLGLVAVVLGARWIARR